MAFGNPTHATPTRLLPRLHPHHPQCVALCDPDWRRAMQDEFQTLQQNCTWTLVPRPIGVNHISGKWLFKNKLNPDDMLERRKARWVVRGFKQRQGIDFDQTFSPIVKGTIHTLLHLAALQNWPVNQLDVKNAFLHGSSMPSIQTMSASSTNLCMGSNRPHKPGTSRSPVSYTPSGSLQPSSTPHSSSTSAAMTLSISFYTSMILCSRHLHQRCSNVLHSTSAMPLN
jgi:hypothetical protein